MACANDKFYIKDTHYKNINYKIPCRWCINCRVDRRNEWKARAEYEFKKHISGAFVTFTYNEMFIPLVKGNDGKIRATIKKKDAQDFIERLRKKIQKEPENILRQKNFTYLGVSEYGENGKIFDRPHYHILFFGLDYLYNKQLFLEEWKNGFIDSIPILNGGINYVLKYMDKQIMGKQARFENYGRYRLEEPKQFQSKGFGNELYYNNTKNIQENNGKIKSGMKYIQVPQYYKNKMKIIVNQRQNTFEEQYFPIMNNLSAEPILNKELYVSGEETKDNDVWGYGERFSEWKSRRNQVSGFSELPNTISEYDSALVMARRFDKTPELNANFVTAYPSNYSLDGFTSDEEPPFDVAIRADVNAYYPMPYATIPQGLGTRA